MSRGSSHYTRSYFGEFDAAPLVQWLNLSEGKATQHEPVRHLLRLNERLSEPFRSGEHDVRAYLARLVREGYGLAPAIRHATVKRWEIQWSLTHPTMPPLQGLAINKLLLLAEKGLLGRVRKCQRCGKWFYARFRHQYFDSQKCQLAAFRSTPEFKKQRAERARELRQEKRLERKGRR